MQAGARANLTSRHIELLNAALTHAENKSRQNGFWKSLELGFLIGDQGWQITLYFIDPDIISETRKSNPTKCVILVIMHLIRATNRRDMKGHTAYM